jgi:hypothetical protein
MAVSNISAIFSEFSRHFPEDDIHVWKPDTFLTHSALNVYNRYFYSAQDCPNQVSIPMGDYVDPDHTLASLGSAAGLVHTEDNQVQYFKITSDNKYV